MLQVAFARQFRKDWKRLKASGQKVSTAQSVMRALAKGEALSPVYDDHPLHGPWQSHRGCHPQSDTVLIYKRQGETIIFERIGSHAELFE